MCIIVYKPIGLEVSRRTLKRCFATNNDGAGFMYPTAEKVTIQKGFFTFSAFWDAWQKTKKAIGDNVPVVFHFRISTGGKRDKTNCHPHRIAQDLAFAHNGILFSVDKKSAISDTIVYKNRFLADFTGDMLAHHGIFEIISDQIGHYNKFVFMNGVGDVVICNESSGVWHNGIWYSNDTFQKQKTTKYRSYGQNWSWQGDEWDTLAGEDAEPEDTIADLGACGECGEPLYSEWEAELGVCEMCGEALYDHEAWTQYKSEAWSRIGDTRLLEGSK